MDFYLQRGAQGNFNPVRLQIRSEQKKRSASYGFLFAKGLRSNFVLNFVGNENSKSISFA